MNKQSLARATTALLAGAALTLCAPFAASAHVTVGPNQAAAGSYALITFHVPTESATATTTKVVLTIPKENPFASVSYVPVPGWTTALIRETLATPITSAGGTITEAVTAVTWTAIPGHEITADQLGLFALSVGPFPDTGKVAFTVAQSYSDGTVINWNDTSANAEEPAPVLYVNDAAPAAHNENAATVSVEQHGASSTAPVDAFARIFGIGGLVLGVIALVIAVTTRRKA